MSEIGIENVIIETLTGDSQINALDFISHLRAIEQEGKISITMNDENDKTGWNVSDVGFIIINGSYEFPGPWGMFIGTDNITEHSDFPVDDHIKETTWANMAPCGKCNSDCTGGSIRRTVFGKDFIDICNLIFVNPDSKTVACMKKIIDIKMINTN